MVLNRLPYQTSVRGRPPFSLGVMVALSIIDARGFDRVKLIGEATEALLATDETKKRFVAHARSAATLYKAILPDPRASEFAPAVGAILVLAKRIAAMDPAVDISTVMNEIEHLLDESIVAGGYTIDEATSTVDLSQFDFEALRKRFEAGRKRTEMERLKGAVNSKLAVMLRLNRTRADFAAKFQKLIDEYNKACLAGNPDLDLFFSRLLEFAKDLSDEDKRGISEQLSEEELVVFDLLTRPSIQLTAKERDQVKQAARNLLDILKKEKLVLDWRKRQQTRAQVLKAIKDSLDDHLPRAYSREAYEEKCAAVYQHVYESYFGDGRSIYAAAS